MPAPIVLPFNFEPVSVVRGTTTTYTVPAGKYSRVIISYDSSFSIVEGGSATGGAPIIDPVSSAGNSSGFLEIWLKAGDSISLAANNTTGSATGTGAQTRFGATAIAGLNININGTLWRTIQARGSVAGSLPSVSSNSVTITITPTMNFGWIAQEYNKIS